MPSDVFSRPAARRVPRAAAWLAFVVVGLQTGCAAPAPPPAPPQPPAPPVVSPPAPAVVSAPVVLPEAAVVQPVRPRDSALDTLLAYADRVRSLGPTELALEITRLGEPAEPIGQVELALALLQTRLPADTARALGLLQRAQTATTEEARAAQPLVRLLVARAGEQRRLEDALDRQNQQMRDTQRRIDQLTDRLEAVRAIERSLTAPRPQGSNGAPAGGRAAP